LKFGTFLRDNLVGKKLQERIIGFNESNGLLEIKSIDYGKMWVFSEPKDIAVTFYCKYLTGHGSKKKIKLKLDDVIDLIENNVTKTVYYLPVKDLRTLSASDIARRHRRYSITSYILEKDDF